MICSTWFAAILGAVMFAVGCSSGTRWETHSYPLQQRATEEPLIKSVINDELARLEPDKIREANKGYGAKVDLLNITPENVAVVRTTAEGHAAIRKALDESRKGAAGRASTQPAAQRH
jgi:hypothetical protein